MDPLAQARKRQEEKYKQYLATQAAEKASQDAFEAAKFKKQRLDALHQKFVALRHKRSRYTHFDWAATKLQGFFKKWLQSSPNKSEPIVNVFGVIYPISVATQLYDVEEEPFDTPEGRSAYDNVLKKIQNIEHFASRDNQLSPDDVVLFLLACLSNGMQPDPEILFGVFDADTITHLLSLNLRDYDRLSRMIRILNLILNGKVPDPIYEHFSLGTNLEEFVQTLIQDIIFELEEIGKSQARLVEAFWQPIPDDEIQCTNCENVCVVANMFKRPEGSFYYCHRCAPMVGILTDQNGYLSD